MKKHFTEVDWKRVSSFLENKDFAFTYGDGLSSVNLNNLVKFHRNKKLITVTAVRPPADLEKYYLENKLISFKEKPQTTQLD